MHKKSYVFVRTDIPIADQIVQSCHSSMKAGEYFGNSDCALVLLQIKNVNDLHEVKKLCIHSDIDYVEFIEPDDNMGLTSIATKPINKNKGKVFSSYKLWSL